MTPTQSAARLEIALDRIHWQVVDELKASGAPLSADAIYLTTVIREVAMLQEAAEEDVRSLMNSYVTAGTLYGEGRRRLQRFRDELERKKRKKAARRDDER